MDEMENTVAAAQECAAEAPADDAQGTAEIDVTELVGSLMGGKPEANGRRGRRAALTRRWRSTRRSARAAR